MIEPLYNITSAWVYADGDGDDGGGGSSGSGDDDGQSEILER